MVGQSNYERAYLMALASWKLFQHSSEPPGMFAERIGQIGLSKGVSAAAEAVAEDCRQHGLQMSSHRVLKVLSDTLGRYHDVLGRLNSIDEFLEEINKPRAMTGLEDLIAQEHRAQQEPRWQWGEFIGCLILILIFIGIGWLVFR